MKRSNKSTLVPIALLAYLGVMAYVGRDRLADGEYLYYFGVIGVSLIIIALVYIVLRKKEKIRAERDEKLKKTYEKDEDKEKT